MQDYTLAQYKPETFELLAYTETTKQLVSSFGYPADVLELEFDWQYMMKGLTIDKARGNVMKIDRHKYVKIAYHGLRHMDATERKRIYSSGIVRDSFDGTGYSTIDTLFSLAEAYLFMQIVDMKDSGKCVLALHACLTNACTWDVTSSVAVLAEIPLRSP